MSFSDMMSSGRGPGVIGMVLALVVLLGFGTLFMFAFDEGLQGGDQSIESVIAGQAKEIDHLKNNIQVAEMSLASAPARNAAARDFSRFKAENGAGKDRIAKLKDSVAAAQAAIVDREQAFENYKDQYRAFVRGGAKGKTMESLKTATGTTYKNVTFTEVSAVGIQIRHDDGHKRIPFEELPDEMKDYYQFDPNQKAAAVKKENDDLEDHLKKVGESDKIMDQQLALQREKEKADLRVKKLAEIEEKQMVAESLKKEVRDLQRELERAQRKTTGITNVGALSRNLQSKAGRLSALQNEIGNLRSTVSNAP